MVQAGLNVVLYIGDKPVSGQQNASLRRSMVPINITNQITGDWRENLAGLRSWRVNCDGMYVVNAESLAALEDAFINNEEIDISMQINNKKYFGRALITDFPLSSTFNAQFKYKLQLLGSGELFEENA